MTDRHKQKNYERQRQTRKLWDIEASKTIIRNRDKQDKHERQRHARPLWETETNLLDRLYEWVRCWWV